MLLFSTCSFVIEKNVREERKKRIGKRGRKGKERRKRKNALCKNTLKMKGWVVAVNWKWMHEMFSDASSFLSPFTLLSLLILLILSFSPVPRIVLFVSLTQKPQMVCLQDTRGRMRERECIRSIKREREREGEWWKGRGKRQMESDGGKKKRKEERRKEEGKKERRRKGWKVVSVSFASINTIIICLIQLNSDSLWKLFFIDRNIAWIQIVTLSTPVCSSSLSLSSLVSFSLSLSWMFSFLYFSLSLEFFPVSFPVRFFSFLRSERREKMRLFLPFIHHSFSSQDLITGIKNFSRLSDRVEEEEEN